MRKHYPDLFTRGLVCAGAATGATGTCFGDSGGPLVVEKVRPRRRFVQMGVVQGGIGNCGSVHYPDVFVSLEHGEIFEFVRNVTGLGKSQSGDGGEGCFKTQLCNP